MRKQLPTQLILPTDKDRAAFKKRCKELLKPLEDEFNISFKFGRIDETCALDWHAESKMKVHFTRVKKEKTLWDSPAAVAIVDAMQNKSQA